MARIRQSGRLISPCRLQTAHSWDIRQVRRVYGLRSFSYDIFPWVGPEYCKITIFSDSAFGLYSVCKKLVPLSNHQSGHFTMGLKAYSQTGVN